MLASMILRGVVGCKLPTSGTFHTKGVWTFLKIAPPAFALPTPGDFRIPCLLLTHAGVEQQLEIVPYNFLITTALCPHHLVPPQVAILYFYNTASTLKTIAEKWSCLKWSQ